MSDKKLIQYVEGTEGAHNTPCKLCGKTNWEQQVDKYYPLWKCKTKGCKGQLWSE